MYNRLQLIPLKFFSSQSIELQIEQSLIKREDHIHVYHMAR